MTTQILQLKVDRDRSFLRALNETDVLRTAKLRALTLFAVHRKEGRLEFNEFPINLKDGSVIHYTAVYPSYKSIDNHLQTLKVSLVDFDNSEGFMLVSDDDSLGYIGQPQLIVFPATRDEAKSYLYKLTSVGMRFLEDHHSLRETLCKYVREATS